MSKLTASVLFSNFDRLTAIRSHALVTDKRSSQEVDRKIEGIMLTTTTAERAFAYTLPIPDLGLERQMRQGLDPHKN